MKFITIGDYTHLHDCINSLRRGGAWLIPPLVVEMHVQSKEIERWCMAGVSIFYYILDLFLLCGIFIFHLITYCLIMLS